MDLHFPKKKVALSHNPKSSDATTPINRNPKETKARRWQLTKCENQKLDELRSKQNFCLFQTI